MAILDPIPVKVLAARVISSVDAGLAAALKLKSGQRAVSMFTTTCDDVGYVAIDEATKKAEVEVVYASSFYCGADRASGPLSGEFIGILAGPTPADVIAGLNVAIEFSEHDAAFQAANEAGDLAFFAHLVSRCGTYFAAEAGIEVGTSMAYLIAPPLEATYALDAALKAADVQMVKHFPPPSPTNYAGGWLVGSQAACQAACQAFREAVLGIAARPMSYL